MHPDAPAEVRLGIGAAAFKLGRLDVARAAFQRTLQLQPRCVPALTGLAVLAMHRPPSGNVSGTLLCARLRFGVSCCCRCNSGSGGARAWAAADKQADGSLSPEYTHWNVQRLAEALQLLCRAYDLAPGTAMVLNLLAHHCLLRGDYDKARDSAVFLSVLASA